MIDEFKKFILRGNVVDLAVGVIIGAAFGKIVSSFVADILMPPIGVLLGQVDFSALSITLIAKTEESAAVVISYGKFLNTLIDFLIVAFVIFLVIKQMNKLKKPEPEAPKPETRECSECLSTIPSKAKRCHACTSKVE